MQDSPNDSNGVPITVGATVKLVGMVTAINLFNNRFEDITVTILNPLAASAGSALNQPVGGEISPPGYRLVLSFPPGVLTVGS